MDKNLIFGKSDLTRVVSIEPDDNAVKIFRRLENGSLETSFLPAKYWLLCNRQVNRSWVKLKGDLHYQWGRQFETLKDMKTAKFFLKRDEEDLYTANDGKENIMLNKGITYYKDMKPKDLAVLSFDIETTGLDPNASDAKVLLISNTFRDSKGNITKELFSYDDFKDEGEMIDAWRNWVSSVDPDCIIGHNIFGYDLPYLKTRAKLSETDLYLGRDGSAMKIDNFESKFRKDGSQDLHYHKCRIYAREIIDTIFLSIKHDAASKKYDSYGLKNIVKQEGLEKSNRTFYDASQIRHNYKNPEEWNKIKAYCIDDSDDALALFDLMVAPYFYMTQSVPKSFEAMIQSATGAQINAMMVRAYLQQAYSIPKADAIKTSFEGAISFGSPGIFENCVRWDVTSLYPSIIRQYQIYNKEKDPNAYFLEMVNHFTIDRLKNKKLAKETNNSYYKDLEQSQKISINSMYGFLGAPGLQFNYLEGASQVTKYGRDILITAIKWATGLENEAVSSLLNN